MARPEGAGAPQVLLRDRDSKFTRAFDDVFAERWCGQSGRSVLDWVLVWGRRHLERVLAEYVRHYNPQRPHQGVALRPPRRIHSESSARDAPLARTVRRRDRLGGLIHEYYQAAA